MQKIKYDLKTIWKKLRMTWRWSDMSPGLPFSSIRDAMHGITVLTKETGAPHLLNISFSFCWRACPKPLRFVFSNLACSLHSGTPLRKTASFSPVFPMGLGVTPSSWTICNAQGGSAADRILPVCAEILWPDLCTGTWLNSSLLRASACRAGQCLRAFSTLCSSWEATEGAMAVTKRCNPPFCLDFSEAVIAEVYTKKYFTVCREVGIINLQSIMSCVYWKQLPGTLTGLPAAFLISLCTSITHHLPQTHVAPTKKPLAITQLLPDSLTA